MFVGGELVFPLRRDDPRLESIAIEEQVAQRVTGSGTSDAITSTTSSLPVSDTAPAAAAGSVPAAVDEVAQHAAAAARRSHLRRTVLHRACGPALDVPAHEW